METIRQRAEVFMLPIESKSDVILHGSGELGYLPGLSRNTDWRFVEKDWTSQNLYFTTAEKIEKCSLGELNNKEIYWIKYYNSTDKTIGLNIREGGNGKIFSKETIELMRQNALGNTNMLGKNHSDETKKLISKNRSGIKHSNETKKKMSELKKGYKHNNETKDKLSKANKFTRKIKNMKTNIIHESITQAAIDENISQSTIYRGLKDNRYEYI